MRHIILNGNIRELVVQKLYHVVSELHLTCMVDILSCSCLAGDCLALAAVEFEDAFYISVT